MIFCIEFIVTKVGGIVTKDAVSNKTCAKCK